MKTRPDIAAILLVLGSYMSLLKMKSIILGLLIFFSLFSCQKHDMQKAYIIPSFSFELRQVESSGINPAALFQLGNSEIAISDLPIVSSTSIKSITVDYMTNSLNVSFTKEGQDSLEKFCRNEEDQMIVFILNNEIIGITNSDLVTNFQQWNILLDPEGMEANTPVILNNDT